MNLSHLPASLADEFLLRRDIVFLNHGSFGACPRPVFEVYQHWQRELEAQPVEFLGRRFDDLLAGARVPLAAYLHTHADNIAFVPNATFGVNIVARAIDLQPGDEVLATDHEYGASDRTWRFVCGLRGAHYINQPIAVPVDDPLAMVEQLWAGVTPRTKVIFVSHITSPTALIFPIAEICRRAREAGILTVIDGAHAPGQIDLDLDALGADYYTGNLHKWFIGPKGSAFLFARPELQAGIVPLVVSWGWESVKPSHSTFQDYLGWTGTNDPAAFLSAPAAIAFQERYDWPKVRQVCHEALLQLSQEIAGFTGAGQISPDSDVWWAQMRAIPLSPCDPEQVKQRLYDEFAVEVPVFDWHGTPFVRVSVQGYNTAQDLERLVAGLRAIL